MGLRRWAPWAAAVSAAVLLAGCGASEAAQPPATAATSARATATAAPPTRSPAKPKAIPHATATPSPAGPVALPVAPDAGALPQTTVLPSTHSTAFRNAMADLWLAVTTGNPRFGLPAFFPVDAYKQVKAEPYPAADWQYRLWYDFTLDVGAAHSLVSAHAQLVRVIVPSYDADWVYPGDCYNSIGYWHVGGARVVYDQDGQERSFGIASLISWRGVWYVVHFGEVLRPVVTGVVDDPEVGPGFPGSVGGC